MTPSPDSENRNGRHSALTRGTKAPGSRPSDRGDARVAAFAGWIAPFLLVVYLSFKGGGYEAIVRSEVAVAVWWILLVGALVGIVWTGRVSRTGWIFIGVMTAFAFWTGLGILWSESAERSVTELSRVASLLGVFVLAVTTQGPSSLRRMMGSMATAIALVSALSLASRLHPGWFPPNEVAEVLPTEQARLSYPLTYWNGVATLVAIGFPLLVWGASSARNVALRALSVSALPILALTSYYTLSRGGIGEAAVGLIVLLALHPRRFILVPPLLLGGAGATALILAADKRTDLADGLLSSSALDQGNEMLWLAIGVCLVVGLLAAGVEVARRRRIVVGPRISRRTATRATAGTAVVLLAVAIAAGLPGQIESSWAEFKQPTTPGSSPERYTSVSGSGRYQWWSSAVDAAGTDPLKGIGPGTFEYWWARGDGGVTGFVRDAHSLYLETLGELGIPGAILIVTLVFGIVAVGTGRALRRDDDRERIEALAAATAAVATFAAAAAVDWSWEMTVLPVVFLLLGAGVIGSRADPGGAQEEPSIRRRAMLVGLSVVSLIVITIPMLSDKAVVKSQRLVGEGDLLGALDSAKHAEDLLPFAATPNTQEALVLELGGDLPSALEAAKQATEHEPTNWRTWLILSRIEAEIGDTAASTEAYRTARSLNPRSLLFSG